MKCKLSVVSSMELKPEINIVDFIAVLTYSSQQTFACLLCEDSAGGGEAVSEIPFLIHIQDTV